MLEFLIALFEITGTIAFSLSGTLLGIERGLDFFGVVVLGTTTAVGGGILRDILLNTTPPVAFSNPTFVIVASVASLTLMLLAKKYTTHFTKNERLSRFMVFIGIFDACGLGIFTVIGMNAAIQAGFGSNGFLVVFIGVMTGVGGGLTRDIFVHRTPIILKKDIYATASMLGGVVYYLTYQHMPVFISMLVASSIIMAIRFISMYYDLNLPKFDKKL